MGTHLVGSLCASALSSGDVFPRKASPKPGDLFPCTSALSMPHEKCLSRVFLSRWIGSSLRTETISYLLLNSKNKNQHLQHSKHSINVHWISALDKKRELYMNETSGFSVPSVIPKLHIACPLLPVMTDPLYLNLIIIPSRDKQWLLLMEVNASYWT